MHRRDLIRGVTVLAFTRSAQSHQRAESPAAEVRSTASEALPSPVAGIRLVDSTLARQATQQVRKVSPPYLFNHAVRTFLLGSLIGRAQKKTFDEEALYLACIMHDLGLCAQFEGDLPFEIQGAQAAKGILEENGYDPARAEIVWDGIAMHASAIGQFKRPEVALVGAGAGADVLGPDSSEIKPNQLEQIISAYPRLGFKQAFVKTCAEVVRRHPNGASRSFMRDIGERYVEGYRPRNFCDLIAAAPFPE